MDQIDKDMLESCMVDIMENLNPSFKFKALIVSKRLFSLAVVNDIFSGQDQEGNAYNFVTKLHEKTSTDVTLFIEALEGSGQADLATTLKKSRKDDIAVLRRGVKAALAKGSDDLTAEGRVPVDEVYIIKCRQFAEGATDDVPQEFKYKHIAVKTHICISEECAQELIRHLGGSIEVTLARRNNGYVQARQADGEALRLDLKVVVKSDGEDAVTGLWVLATQKVQESLEKLGQADYERVTDAKGQVVDVSKKWADWWPAAPVDSSGEKEVHVWMKQGAHHIKPVKR